MLAQPQPPINLHLREIFLKNTRHQAALLALFTCARTSALIADAEIQFLRSNKTHLGTILMTQALLAPCVRKTMSLPDYPL